MTFLLWIFLSLHLLSAVLWVGGMAFALLVLRPSLSVIEPMARIALHGAVFRKFFRVVWHVMPITLITGWLMVGLAFHGFAGVPWPVNLMQLGGIAMAIIFVIIVTGPSHRFQAKLAAGQATAADITPIRKLIWVNLAIGALTLLSAAAVRFH